MRALTVVLLSISAWAQVPVRDSRITDLPSTDTHFQMPVYKTLAEGEARRAHLKRQILSAAGLWPMPVKHDLHAPAMHAQGRRPHLRDVLAVD